MRWLTDVNVEETCQKYGVKWRVQTIALDQIDWEETRENPGRPESRLNEDHVNRYGVAMLDGDAFPRIVVREGPKGYVIVGGNHRAHAARQAGFTAVEAYVVEEMDAFLTDNLPVFLNEKNGWELTIDQRLAAAQRQVEMHGSSKPEAAKLHGVNPKMFYEHLRAVEAAKTLIGQNVDPSVFPKSVLTELRSLDFSDVTFIATAKFLLKHRLQGNVGESKSIIRQVRDCRSEKAGMAFLQEREADYAGQSKAQTQARAGNRLSKRDRFMRAMRTFNTVITPVDLLTQLQVRDKADIEALTPLAFQVWEKLGRWFNLKEVASGRAKQERDKGRNRKATV